MGCMMFGQHGAGHRKPGGVPLLRLLAAEYPRRVSEDALRVLPEDLIEGLPYLTLYVFNPNGQPLPIQMHQRTTNIKMAQQCLLGGVSGSLEALILNHVTSANESVG